jgi:hypothetical protein
MKVFLPDVGRLRPGDIVLSYHGDEGSAGKAPKLPKMIRAATGGRFSHALICSQPPALIEATLDGVGIVSLGRCFVHRIENVRVLRYPDPAVAARAARLAQLEVGRDYSIPRAAQSILLRKSRARVEDRGIFCSALVAQVFAEAGADAFKRTPVEKTTPATIEQLDILVDVTNDIFREAPAPNNAEQMTALDGDPAPTPSSRQTQLSNRYAKAVLGDAQRIVAAHPSAGLEATPTYFGMLDFILRAHDAALNLDEEEATRLAGSLNELDNKLAGMIVSGDMEALITEFRRIEDDELQRNIAESFAAKPDIDANAMRANLGTTRIQLDVRRRALQEMVEWNAGRSRSVGAYCTLEESIIAALERRRLAEEEILTRIT